ncbi:6696_t:CDS:2 [Funneliformis caledonium]|uniref:6696_t:CDS:1 n=1 Tax=Funneliformis caledonium TaxID=1117310 RepID=A0A9N9C5S0_9GLOM|nr:6696_t:CDS:2 [Funneliformis caledonium]
MPAEVPDKFKTSDKLEKLLVGDIVLNCLISDENVNGIFSVTISNANNNRVSSLAEAIRNCHLDLFKNIDSSRLKLYKNKENADSVIIHNLINDNVAILGDTELIDPENAIYSYFNGRPKLSFQSEKGINVIVYPPAERVPKVLSKDN